MTAVANGAFTAANFNQYVRDNLNETAPAKATTAGSLFVATGANAIAERTPGETIEFAAESTTSTSYTDLTTPGPSITRVTSTRALVGVTSDINNNTVGAVSFVSFAISGATTVAADDNYSLFAKCEGSASGLSVVRASAFRLITGLTAGSHTFTMKYRVTSGSGTFNERSILVIPL